MLRGRDVANSKLSIFIGSSSEGLKVARWLKRWLLAKVGEQVSVRTWKDGSFRLSEAYLESLTRAAREVDFAILIATADDVATIRHQKGVHQARDNVIFELGLFMGKLGRWRSFLVCTDDRSLRLPTDLSGVSVARFKQSRVDRGELSALEPAAREVLKAIQSAVDEDGGYFVLFPALRNDPFYLDLLAGISGPAASTRDVTFLVPSEAYSGPEFLAKLDELVGKQRGFKGGIVAATLSGVKAQDIRRTLSFFRIPIVVVDVDPYRGMTLPDNIYYVGINNRKGGALAGGYLVKQLADIARPRVLVLANDDQADRHEAFIERTERHFEVVVQPVQFSAEEGKRWTLHALMRASEPFHAIFAVSDELALGAVAALAEYQPPPGSSPIVVGFDGFAPAKLLIDSGLTPFRNTVVQDPYELGKNAMILLRRVAASASRARPRKRTLLDVKLYDPRSRRAQDGRPARSRSVKAR
jgi:DNA-binding LacI/PurR family transcriptional regulator